MASVAVHGLLLAVWLAEKPQRAAPESAGVIVELVSHDSRDEQVAVKSTEVESVVSVNKEKIQSDVFPVRERVENEVQRIFPEGEMDIPSRQVKKTAKKPLIDESTAIFEPSMVQHQRTRGKAAADTQARKTEGLRLRVRDHLEGFKFYPGSARRRGIEGAVDVRFQLNSAGYAEAMQVVSGSGYSILDDAARQTVHRAEPFPASGGSYRFRLVFSRS
ncbi:MAG: energy transducer TonB [Mariprofundaceae bacterium]